MPIHIRTRILPQVLHMLGKKRLYLVSFVEMDADLDLPK
jgi:hypothetical protein